MKKKTDTETLVPNGTAADKLAEQYLSFAKKSAENIIKAASIIVEANKLSELDRGDFCKAVKLEYSGDKASKYRKLLKIGQEASRFDPFLDQLPNSWTTLYKLAALKKDQFDRVTKAEQFAPMMTAADVDLILGGGSGDDDEELKKKLPIDCSIRLGSVEFSKKKDVCRKLMSLAEEYGFDYDFSVKLTKEIVPPAEKPSLAAYLRLPEKEDA